MTPNPKCRLLLKIFLAASVYISVWGPLSPPPPSPYEYIPLYRNYSHREGGLVEPVRRLEVLLVHKRGRKYQLHLQSINSIKHQKRRHLGFAVFDPCVAGTRSCRACRAGAPVMPGSGWDPSPPAPPSSSARPFPGQSYSYTSNTPLPAHEKIFQVLAIPDILVRIRIWILGSVPLNNGRDPDPTLDPTPFFNDFKDAKNIFFFIILFCRQCFRLQSAQHIYEKRKGSGSGRPKNMRILRIRIPNTRFFCSFRCKFRQECKI